MRKPTQTRRTLSLELKVDLWRRVQERCLSGRSEDERMLEYLIALEEMGRY